MVEQARQYRLGDPQADTFAESTLDQPPAPYRLRRSAGADTENSVPLFLSGDGGEPDPSEYIHSFQKKRINSSSLQILAGVCTAAAMMFALFSSDATQSIAANMSDATQSVVANIKASTAAFFPAPSSAALSHSSQLVARDAELKIPTQSSTIENQKHDVGTEAVAPTREEIKEAYQSALQGHAPAAASPGAELPPTAAVADPVVPTDAIHPLDPGEIASLLRRADALIASGDLAAARLVLRRAADAGNAQAAMTLAGTYDPAVLEKLGVHGFVPDAVMARNWYEKAKKFGAGEATQRLELLASKQH